MLKTSSQFVEYAQMCLKLPTVYAWGALGQRLSAQLLGRLALEHPEHYWEQRLSLLNEKISEGRRLYCFDCSGLLKRFVMGGLVRYKYAPELDLNCKGLLDASPRKGAMDSFPAVPGICLYMEGHTAIYEGDGFAIEATLNPSFGDGVVRTALDARPWTAWYEMPSVDYGNQLSSFMCDSLIAEE